MYYFNQKHLHPTCKLLDGVHLFLVDMGDDVPLLKTAGLGRGGQTLVGGDIGQADDQHTLGKELNS